MTAAQFPRAGPVAAAAIRGVVELLADAAIVPGNEEKIIRPGATVLWRFDVERIDTESAVELDDGFVFVPTLDSKDSVHLQPPRPVAHVDPYFNERSGGRACDRTAESDVHDDVSERQHLPPPFGSGSLDTSKAPRRVTGC